MTGEEAGLDPGLVRHPDGRCRCWWAGTDPLYVAYHDTEWGVPEWDDRALFEKLILDGFQAGLAWITILRKRDAFRRAFAGFEPAVIAGFGEAEIEALMADAGIVRNRAKIVGTVAGARAWLRIQEGRGFARFLWDPIDGRPVQGATTRAGVATETEVSRRLSKALKAEGFAFVGPTIVHAFMQAVGMVNDHLAGCHRREACAAMPGPGGLGRAA